MAIRCIRTTNIQPESEIRGSLLLINPKPKGEGFINGKLLMTEDKGSWSLIPPLIGRYICEYTIVAMVI